LRSPYFLIIVMKDNFRILWQYIKRSKKTVILTVVLALLVAIFEGSVPYLYGLLVDQVSADSPAIIIFSLLGIWTLTTLLLVFSRRFVSIKGDFIAIDALRDSVVENASHIVNLPLTFHREKQVGETVSVVIRAGDYLKTIIGDTIFWVAPRFLTVLVGFVIMALINWQLALLTIIIFVISAWVSLLRTNLVVANQKILNERLDRAAGLLNDSFLNIGTIKSSNSEKFQGGKIENIYDEEIGPAFRKVSVDWTNTQTYQEGIFSLGFVLVFGLAVMLLNTGAISAGVLVMFVGYLNLVRMPLMFILWNWLNIQRGMAAIKRARELLDLDKEDYGLGKEILDNVSGEIEYKGVEFSYDGKKERALAGINFTAHSGQKVALVGGSGEGKTTTMDLLSLYFRPSKGEITLDGVNIAQLDLKFLRSLIAYVPQEIILFNDTIKNNILYGKPNATNREIQKAAEDANIAGFINNLPNRYDTVVGERGVKLSVGQKQRLAIARALIRDPKILVLDEATSSLDVKSEKLVQEALEKLEKNKTTFIIAHRLSTVRSADKILVLEKGKVIESGNHEELINKKGAYFKFYNLQFSPTEKTF